MADREYIAGVDEAGRGPLAGPVTAAAVILPADCSIEGLNDSKKLNAARRQSLARAIKHQAIAWALAWSSPARIDAINIRQATLAAMQEAVAALATKPTRVLIDGNDCPDMLMPARAIIGGDGSEPAISAASILAKVARDAYMQEMDSAYPGYGFARHKGYGTAAHVTAIAHLGACSIHRRSFAPVRKALAGELGSRSADQAPLTLEPPLGN